MAKVGKRSFRDSVLSVGRRALGRAFSQDGARTLPAAEAIAAMLQAAYEWLMDSQGYNGPTLNPNPYFETLSRSGLLVPDGWVVAQGAVSAYAMETTTVRSGQRAFKYTGDGTNLILKSELFPFEEDEAYDVSVTWQADEAGAGTTVTITLEVMAGNQSTVEKDAAIIGSTQVAVVDTWQTNKGGAMIDSASDGRYARVKVEVSATVGKTVILDNIRVEKARDPYWHTSFHAYLANNSGPANYSAGADVVFDTDAATDSSGYDRAWDNGGNYNASTGVYTAPMDAEYEIGWTVHANGLTAGENSFSALYIDGGTGYARRKLSQTENSSVNDVFQFPGTEKVKLRKGDAIKIQFDSHTDTTATVLGSGVGERSRFWARAIGAY